MSKRKETEYDKLYEEFRKTHCKLYIIGIDLGSEPDRTAIMRSITARMQRQRDCCLMRTGI